MFNAKNLFAFVDFLGNSQLKVTHDRLSTTSWIFLENCSYLLKHLPCQQYLSISLRKNKFKSQWYYNYEVDQTFRDDVQGQARPCG